MLQNEPANDFFDKRSFPRNSDLEITRCPSYGSDGMSIIPIHKSFQIVLCKKCGFSYLNPRLKKPFMLRAYEGKEYFSAKDMTFFTEIALSKKEVFDPLSGGFSQS